MDMLVDQALSESESEQLYDNSSVLLPEGSSAPPVAARFASGPRAEGIKDMFPELTAMVNAKEGRSEIVQDLTVNGGGGGGDACQLCLMPERMQDSVRKLGNNTREIKRFVEGMGEIDSVTEGEIGIHLSHSADTPSDKLCAVEGMTSLLLQRAFKLASEFGAVSSFSAETKYGVIAVPNKNAISAFRTMTNAYNMLTTQYLSLHKALHLK